MKTLKSQVMVTHNRRAAVMQVSIREFDGVFFAVISDYIERKKVIFKRCNTLLEAGMEYNVFINKLKTKGCQVIPVNGNSIEFSANSFDFSKECQEKPDSNSEKNNSA